MKVGKTARFTFFTVFLLALSIFAAEAAAQTKPRKKTPPKTKPTARIVVPSQTEPEVIARADDFPEETGGNVTVPAATTEQPETIDDKLDRANTRIKELTTRIKSLEKGQKNDYDEKQKRLLLNLDILTRAEQRAESLRKQLFDMVEKESALRAKLDQIENDIRPEVIERSVAFAGTLRPEELREMKRKNLDIERKNIQTILTQLQTTRANMETSVQRADSMVEKLRFKLEKDIDDALAADDDKKEN